MFKLMSVLKEHEYVGFAIKDRNGEILTTILEVRENGNAMDFRPWGPYVMGAGNTLSDIDEGTVVLLSAYTCDGTQPMTITEWDQKFKALKETDRLSGISFFKMARIGFVFLKEGLTAADLFDGNPREFTCRILDGIMEAYEKKQANQHASDAL